MVGVFAFRPSFANAALFAHIVCCCSLEMHLANNWTLTKFALIIL